MKKPKDTDRGRQIKFIEHQSTYNLHHQSIDITKQRKWNQFQNEKSVINLILFSKMMFSNCRK